MINILHLTFNPIQDFLLSSCTSNYSSNKTRIDILVIQKYIMPQIVTHNTLLEDSKTDVYCRISLSETLELVLVSVFSFTTYIQEVIK